MFPQPSERGQILSLNCFDVYHKMLDSSERQSRSKTYNKLLDSTLMAGDEVHLNVCRRRQINRAILLKVRGGNLGTYVGEVEIKLLVDEPPLHTRADTQLTVSCCRTGVPRPS